ncbi:hypothetical protein [Novosphingobium sp. FKTRR1]|uniref:hypothetical protein n=1 Tax=Novosphingobium sp. FKTRR1 TaxID=2879118 RepID=UPI001CEFECEA|nr:hypothetical protein [Novosphingobium sp. FKTRR1]
MTRWHPNLGNPPTHVPGEPEDAPALTHAYVRLRNGIEPPAPWPITAARAGAPATRWAFGMHDHPFDITHWRPA